ncbi:putative ubiquitination network signaling protein [Aspergillus clavatus NRRL 1]|uniref:Probable ubiquitination network signaling protein acrB n=1 Tax=Aspergillus clavatus (strain ATCC 1007 / CBS 513.65 / DSM 816 / NCTC 3887 / NRRL 1 / QM 1276 / 107) TaxID=344612 RepID=ACRB_ASPCL|nr:ubiquitination network signaling protein, putative [Aspergillus clavatus NRRL 1]A1CIK0.1 RecName: Full=Probable ubiquitination network signaling protein acrB; AltName: Full=Acriflavine resistance protein B [Aspergillus clavatus NRRL 1]EAW10705.1 ubiquitination network signaling protein, putative [Aspergillus clavatus NRRL 1]
MPRSSATARKNQSNRNENGASSGKKVAKQKSNGHLNGSLNGGSTPGSVSSSQVDLPSSRSTSDSAIAPAAAASSNLNGISDSSKEDCNGREKLNGYTKGNADMSYVQTNGAGSQNGGDHAGQASHRTDKSATGAKRSTSNASINPLQLASTILKSCPMYDTIAILIFLLQLPPMVLTLVQFLFASLTFMPPSGASAGSLSSNFDIFQGPAGTPSLSTMIAMDGFCLLIWALLMWTWAQNFALDLAHVQVAITLGGGGSGKNGGVNTLCVGIVLILHLIRSKGIQDFVIGHLLSSNIISPDLLAQYSHLLPTEFRRTESQTSPSWIRSLLAVHILAQAGTAMARRSMAKNRSPNPPRPGKRVDTEASAGSQTQIDSAFESGASVSSYLGPDGQLITPTAHKDGRDRLLSAKKRRRQANQVRSRQPFWAALASTKVTVMREYEHSRALSKTARGLPMTENDLQGVSFDDGLVWITDVDASTIKFAAGDFASADDSGLSGACEDGRLGNEEIEPFYVCVNGALWATATISRVPDAQKGSGMVHWRGEVSGLAPNCAYTCSFMRSDTDEEICAISVKTPVTNDTEQFSLVSPPPQPSYRPSSPTTTLKNSIVNAEAKLNEKRSRLRKAKNDHKLIISKIRKELDNYNHRLHSGTDENRQKQRSLQLERNIRQTEEATALLEGQLDSLENIPEEELREWSDQKAKYDQELQLLNSAKEELVSARSAVAREVSSLESDLGSTVQRRERLQSRRTRVNEQYERIVSANAQGLNERERRAAEQFAREQDQAKLEANFNEQFGSIGQSVQEYQLRAQQIWQQCDAIEQAIQQQQQRMLLDSAPLTPEGNLPGTNPFSETSALPLGALTSTAPNSRSLLGLSFPAIKSSPLQTISSALDASSSHPTSPVQPPSFLNFPASPLVNATSHLDSDFTYRDRSFSNRSARSSLYGSEFLDSSRRQPFQIDLPELLGEKRNSGSDSTALKSGLRPVSSPFQRAGSRGSGSGSNGSGGSGSGSGSPSSAYGKPN